MGTLYDQRPRDDRQIDFDVIESVIDDLQKIAKAKSVDIATVIAIWQLLEASRRNDLYVANGDIWDEQIGGIGEELRRIAEVIELTVLRANQRRSIP
jgi:hypothetical protein